MFKFEIYQKEGIKSGETESVEVSKVRPIAQSALVGTQRGQLVVV